MQNLQKFLRKNRNKTLRLNHRKWAASKRTKTQKNNRFNKQTSKPKEANSLRNTLKNHLSTISWRRRWKLVKKSRLTQWNSLYCQLWWKERLKAIVWSYTKEQHNAVILLSLKISLRFRNIKKNNFLWYWFEMIRSLLKEERNLIKLCLGKNRIKLIEVLLRIRHQLICLLSIKN
jgi:hypothetical protein